MHAFTQLDKRAGCSMVMLSHKLNSWLVMQTSAYVKKGCIDDDGDGSDSGGDSNGCDGLVLVMVGSRRSVSEDRNNDESGKRGRRETAAVVRNTIA